VWHGGHTIIIISKKITLHLAHSRHVLAFHHCNMRWNTTRLIRARSTVGRGWKQGTGAAAEAANIIAAWPRGGHHRFIGC